MAGLVVILGLAGSFVAGKCMQPEPEPQNLQGHSHVEKTLHFECKGCGDAFTGSVRAVLKAAISPVGSTA